MLSKVRAELDEALKKAQTSSAAEMTAKEELKEQAVLAKEVIVTCIHFFLKRIFVSVEVLFFKKQNYMYKLVFFCVVLLHSVDCFFFFTYFTRSASSSNLKYY